MMKRALLLAMAAVALCAAADALSADAINRVPPVAREFKYEDGRTIYPSYRTWDFEVDEPGLYVFDVVSPDAKTRPAVREWLDGTQIAFSFVGKDYAEKADAHGRLRRFRWLEPGIHTLDLYLNVGGYPWDDEMEKAMNAKGVKVLLYRPADGEFGFWMEGTDPDCMARLMGEPLVVAGCAANVSRKFTIEVSDGWSQTLAVSNAPVRFEYPCYKEGAFEYVVRDDKGEVVEGPWDFVVTDIGRKEQTDLLTSNDVRGTVSGVSREQIRVLNLSPAARAVLDAGRELWKYYHIQPDANPNASYYDIRAHFQGCKPNGAMNAKSNDASYNALVSALRTAHKALAAQIEPKVYEYGFLKR